MEICCNNSPFDCLLLDLDDTLYPSSHGILHACKQNINEFISMKFGMPSEQASSLRLELFKKYGSCLAGFTALGYAIHPDEYHSFVHGLLPYEKIRPNPELRDLLLSIPQKKIIFTNSDKKHASRVLEKLCIEEECFEKIICFETLNPGLFVNNPGTAGFWQPPPVVLKPFIAAIEAAIDISGFEPHRTLFLDDNEKNIAAGKAVGLCTVLVGRSSKVKEADYAVESILSLREAIPEIWDGGKTAAIIKKSGGSGEHSGGLKKVRNAIRSTTSSALVEA